MIGALKYESVRLLTLRSTYWLTGIALVLAAAVAGLMAAVVPSDEFDTFTSVMVMGGASLGAPSVGVFMALLGVFCFGHEYRHGLILQTLTAVPRRSTLIGAKIVVMAVWAALIAIVSLLLNWLVVAGFSGEVVDLAGSDIGMGAVGGWVGYVVLYCLLGLGLAAMTRGTVGGIIVILVVPMLIEPTLTTIGSLVEQAKWLGEAMMWAPFNAAGRMFMGEGLLEQTGGGAGVSAAAMADVAIDLPGRLASSLTFGLWAGAIVAIGWILFQNRDA